MEDKAQYDITITRPTTDCNATNNSHARERVRKFRPNGSLRELNPDERTKYERNRAGFPDLTFNTPFDGIAILNYTIIDESDFRFADTPFTIGTGSETRQPMVGSFRRLANPKKAQIIIHGTGGDGPSPNNHKYLVHYIDSQGTRLDHDPVINNGTLDPGSPQP